MRITGLLLAAWFCLSVLPAMSAEVPRLVTPRAAEWSGPWLRQAVTERPEQDLKAWVFFTDKGILTEASYRRAVQQVESGWNADTRKRRGAADSPAEFSDIPVARVYVQALENAGFKVHRVSRWLNAASIRAPAGNLNRLAQFEFVRFVQPVLVSPRRSDPLPVTPPDLMGLASDIGGDEEASFYGLSYLQSDQIGALELHRMGYTGAGVKVMVIDTGFQSSHVAFQNCTNLAGQYDFINDDANTENEGGDVPSQHSHGTIVWSAAGGYAPGDVVGPAWAATFYLAKTEDVTQEVRSEEDSYVAALEWADTLGVDITTASLSYLCFDGGFCYGPGDLDGDTAVITTALDLAVSKGICCLNAVGNNGVAGPSSMWTPQDADSVISVGAVDALGDLAVFSSYGPTADGRIKPEVVARGVSTYGASASSGGYGFASGTSLATPLVAGLAALVKEAQPGWTGADIREALMETADSAATPDNGYGWGLPHGPSAIIYLGALPEPPRMTLPFALCEPPDSAVVSTIAPKLIWSASAAAMPGDTAAYSVFYSINGAPPDSFPSTLDTCLAFNAVPAPGDTVTWWVHAVGDSGYVRKSIDTRAFVVDATVSVPDPPASTSILLGVPRPNPSRGGISFAYRLPQGEAGVFQIYNAEGRLVRTLPAPGTGSDAELRWDGLTRRGLRAVPGAYFGRLSAAGVSVSRKLVLLP